MFVLKILIKYAILLPLSVLYGLITYVRNKLYDFGVLKSYSPQISSIVVGNLAVGGTGKTPHAEMILSLFENQYKVAFLSRGYKRKSKGFLLADANTDCLKIGDEPYQIFRKFKNTIVAVDENRVHGVNQLLNIYNDLELVLLDDAFQHRAINPGFKIILTDYSNLYTRDSMLPFGALREYATGSRRTDVVVVTKCPRNISEQDSDEIRQKLKLSGNQSVYFSTILYDSIRPLFDTQLSGVNLLISYDLEVLLVTGIVSHLPLVEKLEMEGAKVEVMAFSDHHQFTIDNYAQIERNFISLPSMSKIILVTEKDAARIVEDVNFPESLKKDTYYIPITIEILHNKQSLFETQIKNYVETNKRNG